jgi:alanine-glyoxylate transaminase/serine-glyoxylate transaminase/serine-pyruvate transaminase
VGPRAREAIANRKTAVANWYLDLSLVGKYWGQERTYHHTAPISMNYALYEALCMVEEEGLENRWARHRENAEYLWSGLEELGLKPIVPVENRLPSLTTVSIPDGIDEKAVRAELLTDYNIEIAGGLGIFAGVAWRIGCMGDSSRRENVTLLLGALRQILQK